MPFIQKNGVTDICIDKPSEIYVEQNSQFTHYVVDELDFCFLESLASLIAEYNHKDLPLPLFSGSSPSGERIQFVMPP